MSDPGIEISRGELIQLCALDAELFSRHFFPKTVRQASPPFHSRMWDALDDPSKRLVNLRCFRGSAKTTILRLFTAKRIAYGISHTILYVGASEAHAARSIQWLRGQIERNREFADTFGLRPGKKWQETEIEVFHGVDDRPIWILGVGITGNIRGINFDDYRPDLIVLDDIVTDENAATEEQRGKIVNLVFGALKESLTPATEEPNAKMALAQTPMHGQDVSSLALKDPQWHSEVFSCWTPETLHLDVDQQESSWPERFTTEQLRADKKSAIFANRSSIFIREMECRLISAEECLFRSDWLKYYPTAPKGMFVMIGVDPVPPPSDREIAKGLTKKDYEAITAVGRFGGNYYLLEYALAKGHNPDWTIAKIFELAMKWRAAGIVVESVAYQRTLKWLIEKEMQRRHIYYSVVAYDDSRKKFHRISSTLMGPAQQGKLFVHASMTEFISAFGEYPNVDHDDLLDGVAIAMSKLTVPALELGDGDYQELDAAIPAFEYYGGCP